MAQADYIISNQTFPNTRADINSHLQAIATNNSGTSAPTTQYAGQFWIDTTSSTWTLYIHDGSDDIQFATIDTSANTVNFTDSALDVVTDTTPQLGGNLDLNSNDITGTGNINITGNLTSTGIDDNATSTAITIDSSQNVDVVGTTTSSNFISDGTGYGIKFPLNGTATLNTSSNSVIFTGSGSSGDYLAGTLNLQSRGNLDRDINLITGATASKTITAHGNGDVSFYEDTGTTAKFFWDASAERLGIGTASPSQALEVNGLSYPLVINSTTSNLYKIQFKDNGVNRGYIGCGSTAVFSFANSSASELMRIDSSGNLLVGTTSAIPGVGNTTLGASLRNNGGGSIAVSRGGDNAGYFNRNTSDGSIVSFRKDGTEVGSIGTVGTKIFIGSFGGVNPAGFRFQSQSTPGIYPCTSDGSFSDNLQNLGATNARFKDLYLGGGLYVGGTGTANKLSDYEEGTWTPSIQASGTHYSSITHTVQNGRYTKVGRQVFAHFRVTISAVTIGSASGNINVEGLPFTCSSADSTNQAGTVSYVSDVNFNLSSFGTLNIGLNAYQNQNKGGLVRSRNSGTADGLHNSSIGQATDIVGTFIYFVD